MSLPDAVLLLNQEPDLKRRGESGELSRPHVTQKDGARGVMLVKESSLKDDWARLRSGS